MRCKLEVGTICLCLLKYLGSIVRCNFYFEINILCFLSDFFNSLENKWQVFADLSVSAMQTPSDLDNLLTTNAIAAV